jgi:hypothetical protein
MSDILGIEWAVAHREAERLQHAISPLIEDKMLAALGHPTACPHGNPIPGMMTNNLPPDAITLDNTQANQTVEITHHREGERDPRLLDYLQKQNLIPGARITVQEVVDYTCGDLQERGEDDCAGAEGSPNDLGEANLSLDSLQSYHHLHRDDKALMQTIGAHTVDRFVAQAAAILAHVAARPGREVQLGATGGRSLPHRFDRVADHIERDVFSGIHHKIQRADVWLALRRCFRHCLIDQRARLQ